MSSTNPLSDAEKSRAELLAVLEEFHVPVSFFDGRSNSSIEKYIAGFSPQRLKEFYLKLLEPGLRIAQVSAWCPPWPAGCRYAGGRPSCVALHKIRLRLVEAREEAEKIEHRLLVLREKQMQLRQHEIEFHQKKLQVAATPDSSEASSASQAPPSSPEAPEVDMVTRIYGPNPFRADGKF